MKKWRLNYGYRPDAGHAEPWLGPLQAYALSSHLQPLYWRIFSFVQLRKPPFFPDRASTSYVTLATERSHFLQLASPIPTLAAY